MKNEYSSLSKTKYLRYIIVISCVLFSSSLLAEKHLFKKNIVCQNHQVTVYPQAGDGGTINPNTPQTVQCGGFLKFFAYPDDKHNIDFWYVNDNPVQLTGSHYSLWQINSNFKLNVTFVPKPSMTYVVAGEIFDDTAMPFLMVSHDNGDTWNSAKLPIITGQINLEATDCTGNGDNALCVVVGSIDTFPLLIVTKDGAKTWTANANFPHHGQFHDIACTGQGADAICTAVGEQTGDDQITYPLLAVSRNGGKVWQVIKDKLPIDTLFYATSCIGSGKTATCIAAGGSKTFLQPPILYVSQDGGKTWKNKVVTNENGVFIRASCTGEGGKAVCAVSGGDKTTQKPLLAVSSDNGISWSMKNIELHSTLNALSCTGTTYNAICVAAGKNDGPLFISKDRGLHWVPIPNTDYYRFTAANCTGEGETSICVLGARDSISQGLITIHSGNDWADIHFSFRGVLEAISCIGDRASNTICLGGTYDETARESNLVMSSNWEYWQKVNLNLGHSRIHGISGFRNS